MIQVSSYTLIRIGLFTRYLRQAGDEPVGDISKAISALHDFISDPVLNFSVTLQGMEGLLNFRDKIKESGNAALSANDKKELVNIVGFFEQILYAEAETKYLFLLSERRFNTKYLLEKPEHILGNKVYESLPEISRFDFRQGCQCIVFGQATAAAFHILRATEGVLKDYYYRNIKRNREKNPMWGNMISGLRTKRTKTPPTVLLDSLDMIRKSYRNPTNHPEAIYTLEEAQDLLGLCIDVINKMASSNESSA